ncbi:DNA/RNA non-specific endonuclease [Apilactobacillus timberlakei]|uniref:DNA/RNA non-specific endonuclease n=1 Tax=Apilactobacillus timberlakei TaxID=2008380 RepID=UPI00112B1705|nr:DNA/RNA non-specific endonuclease [Apilactobacillus timberlakei]TPR14983.1 DNA/RNA non-specific endonuclease [Apilactobacillus timberlakei]
MQHLLRCKIKKILCFLIALGTVSLLTGCNLSKYLSENDEGVPLASANLTKKEYVSGNPAYITLQNNRSTLLKEWKDNHVKYSDLDKYNRLSNSNVGYLEPRNLVKGSSLRTKQVFKPSGWHQKFVDGQPILNRGHAIAYSLSKGISVKGSYDPSLASGDQDNPKNLFTQTAFSNQKVQTIFESKVRQALHKGKRVIYEVTPAFKDNELMPRGVHLQAISMDSSLNFNVYIYNVQPNIKFDYKNGTSKIDRNMKVPVPPESTFN